MKLMLPYVRKAVRDARSRVMVTFRQPFDLAVVRCLCCFATLHMYLASATIFFLKVAADNGHTHSKNIGGVTVKFKTGETQFFPSVSREAERFVRVSPRYAR